MLITQISIFIENRFGRLAEITAMLADAGVNIHALSLADTTDYGIMRLIVSDPENARAAMKECGLMVKSTEVIAVSLEHRAGSLASVLRKMADRGISIEYLYAFTSRSPGHDAIVILRLENQDEAIKKLEDSGIELLGSELLKEL